MPASAQALAAGDGLAAVSVVERALGRADRTGESLPHRDVALFLGDVVREVGADLLVGGRLAGAGDRLGETADGLVVLTGVVGELFLRQFSRAPALVERVFKNVVWLRISSSRAQKSAVVLHVDLLVGT